MDPFDLAEAEILLTGEEESFLFDWEFVNNSHVALSDDDCVSLGTDPYDVISWHSSLSSTPPPPQNHQERKAAQDLDDYDDDDDAQHGIFHDKEVYGDGYLEGPLSDVGHQYSGNIPYGYNGHANIEVDDYHVGYDYHEEDDDRDGYDYHEDGDDYGGYHGGPLYHDVGHQNYSVGAYGCHGYGHDYVNDDDDNCDDGYDLDDELLPRIHQGKLKRQRIRKLGKRPSGKMNHSSRIPYSYVMPGCMFGKHLLGIKHKC